MTVTLALTTGLSTIIGLAQLLAGGIDVETDRATVLLDPLGAADAIRLIGASISFTLIVVALAGRRRRGAVWSMEMVRIAALVVTALNALVNFATEGFGALVSVALGLAAVAVLSHQINVGTASTFGTTPVESLPSQIYWIPLRLSAGNRYERKPTGTVAGGLDRGRGNLGYYSSSPAGEVFCGDYDASRSCKCQGNLCFI